MWPAQTLRESCRAVTVQRAPAALLGQLLQLRPPENIVPLSARELRLQEGPRPAGTRTQGPAHPCPHCPEVQSHCPLSSFPWGPAQDPGCSERDQPTSKQTEGDLVWVELSPERTGWSPGPQYVRMQPYSGCSRHGS